MPGVPCTRSLVCEKQKHTSKSPQVHRISPAFPHANGFNGFLRALPGDRAFLSPSQAAMREHHRQLDASVEASEPHDFAVRDEQRFVFAHHRRPPHPAPTSVTIAKRPSCGTGWANHGGDLGKARREIFFVRGLDR